MVTYASGGAHRTIYPAQDEESPSIFQFVADAGDRETLTRSELATYGKTPLMMLHGYGPRKHPFPVMSPLGQPASILPPPPRQMIT